MMMSHSRALFWLALPGVLSCQDVLPGPGPDDSYGGLQLIYANQIGAGPVGAKPTTDETYWFGTRGGIMQAIDLESGTVKWTVPHAGTPHRVAFAGGRLLWTVDTVAIGVDANSGTLLWEKPFNAATALAEGAADTDAFYLGTDETTVYALSAADGEVLWSRDVGADWEFGGIVRGLEVSGDTVYAVVEHNTGTNGHIGTADIFAFDRLTGDSLWVFRYGTGATLSIAQAAPRIARNLLLFQANWENSIVAIDRFTRQQVWVSAKANNWAGPQEAPEIEGDKAFSGAHDAHAEALNLFTGEVVWRTRNDPNAAGIAYFAVCGSRLLVNDDGLSVFDKNTGQWLGRSFYPGTESGRTQGDFVVVNNKVYFFTDKWFVAMQCPT